MTDQAPPSPSPSPLPYATTASAPSSPPALAPFAIAELRRSLQRPHLCLDLVLAERGRLAASIREGAALPALVLLLLACSIAFSVPFAVLRGPRHFGEIALLYTGSVLICFPSLQVFSAYLGMRLHLLQNLAIALIIPAAAALFCFGFFPIYWFLDATMAKDGAVSARGIGVALLTISLALGLAHLNRCLFADGTLRELRSNWFLLLGWQALLVFITYRMAALLGLFA